MERVERLEAAGFWVWMYEEKIQVRFLRKKLENLSENLKLKNKIIS